MCHAVAIDVLLHVGSRSSHRSDPALVGKRMRILDPSTQQLAYDQTHAFLHFLPVWVASLLYIAEGHAMR